jgi:hypothetical protein
MRRGEFPAAAYDRWKTAEPPEGRGPDEDDEPEDGDFVAMYPYLDEDDGRR